MAEMVRTAIELAAGCPDHVSSCYFESTTVLTNKTLTHQRLDQVHFSLDL